MSAYQKLCDRLKENPLTWLVTGVAGFIGSNILETLLKLKQNVVGLDNFITGSRENLSDVQTCVDNALWKNFTFIEGDIRDAQACRKACQGVNVVLHQAALGSVPRSLENPVLTTDVNVQGTVQVFWAAKEAGVKRVVYASSSSVYGDESTLPKIEERLGKMLSPYAVSKMTNELYAQVFTKAYGLETVGLRYFNVFGRRQSPDGPYAAVIPKWVEALLKNQPVTIYGDGKTSRDFCYVDNAVQANILAGQTLGPKAFGEVFNVAVDHATSLNDLFQFLKTKLSAHDAGIAQKEVHYAPFRAGDILHSRADIGKAKTLLGYEPRYTLEQGLDEALTWYCNSLL